MELGAICECNQCVPVKESDAGGSVLCGCGRRVIVPLLAELQARRVVTSAATVERRIRRMLAKGELPGDERCARCGEVNAIRLVNVKVECERSHSRTSGGRKFLILPGIGWMTWKEEVRTEVFGRDTDVAAPIYLCPQCQEQLGRSDGWVSPLVGAVLAAAGVGLLFWNVWAGLGLLVIAPVLSYWLRRRAWNGRQRALKKLLRGVPAYGQLLDAFRYAVVALPQERHQDPDEYMSRLREARPPR